MAPINSVTSNVPQYDVDWTPPYLEPSVTSIYTSFTPNFQYLSRRRRPTGTSPSNGATTTITGLLSPPPPSPPGPGTFQCTLCPKRFTRAYNLRSHLRTHIDERPFVCTVCGQAFARQHNRKLHECLHAGEEKFVCHGKLKSIEAGLTWGCGRRFARMDALGRHFRSEAGRGCIKPLLEEERQEREGALLAQQQARVTAQDEMPLQWEIQHLRGQIPLDLSARDPSSTNYTLPAALLEQYPALAGLVRGGFYPPEDVDLDKEGMSP